jgi:hypothetical protein
MDLRFLMARTPLPLTLPLSIYIQIGITVKTTLGSPPLDTQGGEKV